MERLVTAENLERAAKERIVVEKTAGEAVADVFTEQQTRKAFIEGLGTLGEVKLGGRTVREKFLGCRTIDFASAVAANADTILREQSPSTVRTHRTLKFLLDYPTERMTKPDLDFVLGGENLGRVARIFGGLGFKVEELLASNGVRIAEVHGNNGVATFALDSESWHTQEPWPKIGTIHASFENKKEPTFRVDVGWGSVYMYPFCCPGMGMGRLKDPTLPRNVASAGRSLLGAISTYAPNPDFGLEGEAEYKMLPLPMEGFRPALYKVVEQYKSIVKRIKKGDLEEAPYRSGLRDMSIALFEISLKYDEWDRWREDDFFGQVFGSYWFAEEN